MPTPSLPPALKPAVEFFKRLATIQRRQPKLTVGVDIGSTSIKAVALGQGRGDGPRLVIGQSLILLKNVPGADPAEGLKAALAGLRIPVSTINVSVSGQWVLMRIVEMPKMKPMELKQALPFEAQRYLPFNIQDVVIDGTSLGASSDNKQWVLIVSCKKELLDRRLDLAKQAGVRVALVDIDALALANGLLSTVADGAGGERTRAVLNLGAQLTNLAILRGDVPCLVRDIPWGGDKVIRHVAEQLGMEADAVERDMTDGNTQSPELLNAVKLSVETLATELQLSFDYFENRFSQPPDEVLVTGGLSLSPIVLDAVKAHVTQTVTPWSPAKELSGQFAVAYGLALRAD